MFQFIKNWKTRKRNKADSAFLFGVELGGHDLSLDSSKEYHPKNILENPLGQSVKFDGFDKIKSMPTPKTARAPKRLISKGVNHV